MASLAEVIPQFLSPDNGARQAAEQQLAQHRANPSVFMPELLQLARTFPEPHLRQTAAVLLRKSLDASVWPAIGAPGQTSIKAGLLEGVVAETQDLKTRRALADTISKLAGIASASGGWADLLPFVFKLAIDTDGANKKLGFEILASLSIEVGGDAIVPLLEPLQPVLGGALCAPNALAVRVACLNAVESMVEHVKDKEHRAHQQALQAHLPACLAVLQEALASGDMTHAKECLTSFIAIAESDASFLRPHVDSMLSVAFGVAGADLDENVRHLGLELMITFAEAKPGIARKVPNFVETLVPAMCAMIEDIADDDEWDENIGDEDEKDDMCIPENVRCGEEAMLRLFGAIGGNRSVPASLPIISAKMECARWQQRYAALRALDQLVLTSEKALKEHLTNIVSIAVRMLSDAKPQVAHAAASVVAALCSCFAPDVQQEHHAIILPALMAVLEHGRHGRLRTRAAKCIIDFTADLDEDEAEMLSAYSDAIVSSLTALLTTGSVPQQMAAITALGALASPLEKRFVKYYAHLMPGLMGILQGQAAGATGKDGAALAGRAMDCVSRIADAVGQENFGRDAPAVMEILMKLHERFCQSGDDQNFGFLLQACARIAECMRGSFTVYLEHLMPSIIGLASLDPKLDMQAADGGDGDDDGDYAVMSIKGMGKMRVSINIKALEDKALGISMLSAMAEHLKEHFLPYVKQAAELIVPCCTYKLSGDVREAAIEAIPHVLASVRESVGKGLAAPDMLKELLAFAWPQLMHASLIEPDEESQQGVLEAIASSIDACGSGCLDSAMQEQLCEVLRPLVEDHVKGAGKDDDDDEDADEEGGMMMSVVEVISSGLKSAGAQMVPQVQQKLLPHFGSLLAANRPDADKVSALNCLCEVMDHGGEAAQPMVANITGACLMYCTAGDAAVRRSANYGLAVCAEKGGAGFEPHIGQALAALHTTIVASGARDEENKFATDNAVDAIGRVCKFRSEAINTAEVLPTWLTWLPLTADEDCAQKSHEFLAELLEAKHPAIEMQWQAVSQCVPTIVAADSKLATAEVQQRIRASLAAGYNHTV